FDGRVEADVFLERREVHQNAVQLQGWHLITDDLLCFGRSPAYDLAHLLQNRLDFRRESRDVVFDVCGCGTSSGHMVEVTARYSVSYFPTCCDISRITVFHAAWARSPVAVNTALNSFICAPVSRASSFFPSLVKLSRLKRRSASSACMTTSCPSTNCRKGACRACLETSRISSRALTVVCGLRPTKYRMR